MITHCSVDEVGVDVAYHTYMTLRGALGVRMEGSNPDGLKDVVDRKWLGRKTGKGFYTYEAAPAGGKKGSSSGPKPIHQEMINVLRKYPVPSPAGSGLSAKAMQERMVLRFVKECVHALEDGIIRNAADGDIGAVFGIGFPPFLGGPFRYIDSVGAKTIVEGMRKYASTVGAQFEPPALLVKMAEDGSKFHNS
jgi:3-hydroxyacyl-CoA dehydrogenase